MPGPFIAARRSLVKYPNFQAESVTLFNAMAAKPSDDRKQRYDAVIRSLKIHGVWDKLDALWLLAAHDSAVALINVKNPGTYDLTATNSPTFEADRGYTGDGSTSFLDSSFTPSTAGGNFVQDSAALAVHIRNNIQATGSSIGAGVGGNISNIASRNSSDNAVVRMNTSGTAMTVGSQTDGSGFYVISRTAADLTTLYRDGTSIGTSTTASSGLSANSVTIFKANGSASLTAHQVSFAAILSGATATQAASLRAAVLPYLQAVGAA